MDNDLCAMRAACCYVHAHGVSYIPTACMAESLGAQFNLLALVLHNLARLHRQPNR